MIENNDLNRDLLKLSFLQRVESVPRSKLGLDDFMPLDDELHSILQKHSENITLSEFLEYQGCLENTKSEDVYQKIPLSFMYRLVVAKKCEELYKSNFYCVNSIPNLDKESS